ncbi:MAG: ABC transporter permease [Pyrinomonadaceae bacterium]|nr:ABC transporter permease [Pyrinomonadaceae bacterium]
MILRPSTVTSIFSRNAGRFFIRRAIQSLLLILILIVVNFLLIHVAPGDPVHLLAGQTGDEKYYEFIRSKFGLNQPLTTQLWIYLSSVLRGDLGYSLGYQQPVLRVILERIPATLLLMLSAILLSTTVGVVLGVEAARRENSFIDRAINTVALLGYSIPSFSIGLLLLIVFALHIGLFPAQNMSSANQELTGLAYLLDVLRHLTLPAVTLAIVQVAQVMRLTRTQMLTVLRENFITTARAKGLRERQVVYGHALRNAMIPLVTILGSDVGTLLSGAVLVETVFAWPGLGRLLIDSIAMRDYPVLMGIFLMISISVAVANLFTDIVYSLLDPRIKYA